MILLRLNSALFQPNFTDEAALYQFQVVALAAGEIS